MFWYFDIVGVDNVLTMLVTMCWLCVGDMILRNSQCHCSSSLSFTSLSLSHSSPDHLVFCSKMSLGCCKKPTEKLGEKSWVVSSVSSESGSWWPVGGCRPTDVARNSSAGAPTGGPRWSGGQVVVPPSIQLPGGVFGSSGGTMGRHCSAVVKGHMLRMGGGAPAYNSSKSSSCFSSAASGPKDWPARGFWKCNRRLL